MAPNKSAAMNVSIVLYNTPFDEVQNVVGILRASAEVHTIYLIDNSPVCDERFRSLPVRYVKNATNLGYGAAHNVALRESLVGDEAYHLVLNADMCFSSQMMTEIVGFMNEHENVGQLMPKIFYPDGRMQRLCKLLPTPFDLFGRRFLPAALTKKRTAHFELHASGYDKVMNVPYLSGCFMFLRTSALREVGLFDERYFMYPEDIDLTRRMHERYKTVFYPEVSVEHNHAQQSYKSKKILWIHIVNLARYFNKWGWFWDKNRTKTNRAVLKELGL